jgi:hypothetical protein
MIRRLVLFIILFAVLALWMILMPRNSRSVLYRPEDIASLPRLETERSSSQLYSPTKTIADSLGREEESNLRQDLTWSISGRVTDQEGYPLPGITLGVSQVGGSHDRFGVTDKNGLYTITDLIAGTYEFFTCTIDVTPWDLVVTLPPDATGQVFTATRVSAHRLRLLFVPLRWAGTQEDFDAEVNAQVDVFLSQVPLTACRDQVLVETLDVVNENFHGFLCSPNDCGVSWVYNFVRDELGIDPTDYDIIAGLVEESPCPPTTGCSNRTDTIWSTAGHEVVIAHEIGHIYGLVDQYCSNRAGSNDDRCNDGDIQGDGAATGDINWLDASQPFDCPPDGSDDSEGSPCCNYDANHDCSSVDYGACCWGNKNGAGGRSTMSFADAPGIRGFDDRELAHLGTVPELTCGFRTSELGPAPQSLPLNASQTIIDVNLTIHQDDTVDEGNILIAHGRQTSDSVLQHLAGDYTLAITDFNGQMLWSQPFGLHFVYNGPVFLDVDYSEVAYDAVSVSFRIPYEHRMSTLGLYHGEDLIFSQRLPIYQVYLPLILRSP